MTLQELKELVENGNFHHATDKPNNGVWSGLWIYRVDPSQPCGFSPAGCFSTYGKPSEFYEEAYSVVRKFGVSVGSRGKG